MGRYRKILVAVDGSDSSKNAFRQACRIAREDKSWLTVITAIPLYQDQFEVLSTKEKVSKRLREEGEKILSEIKKSADEEDVHIKQMLAEGSPFETIIDAADAENCDLIVIGRRGLRRIERALIGSVTARVIGYSHRDILVVPRNTTIGWKTIILPTDGSKYSDIATQKAIDFTKSYGGEIKAISAVDVTEEFMAQAPAIVESLVKKAKEIIEDVKKKANSEGIKAEGIVREGEAFKIIADFARDERADVIVMGSYGRTGIKRLLMGSVTEGVIGHSPCPVLVVKK